MEGIWRGSKKECASSDLYLLFFWSVHLMRIVGSGKVCHVHSMRVRWLEMARDPVQAILPIRLFALSIRP